MKRLFILAAITTLWAACSKSPEDTQKELFETGLSQVENHLITEADSTFAMYQREFPDVAEGRYGAAVVLEAKYMYYDALLQYMLLAEADPTDIDAIVGIGRMYRRLGKYDRAAEYLYRASAAAPDNIDISAQLLSVLIDARNFDVVVRVHNQLVQKNSPDNIIGPLEARLMAYRLESDSAATRIAPVLAGSLESPLATRLVADYYEERGLIDSALYWSRQSIDQPSATFIDRQEHFHRSLRNRYWNSARQLMQPLADKEEAHMAYLGMKSLYHYARGDVVDAAMATGQYRSFSDSLLSPIIYDMEALWRRNDLGGCEASIMNVRAVLTAESYPQEYEEFVALKLIAFEIYFTEEFKNAVRIVATDALKSGDRDARLMQLYFLYRTKFTEAADPVIDSLETLHGSDARWLRGIGDVFGQRYIRQFDRAGEYYRRALKLDPFNRKALSNWVDVYVEQLDVQGAQSLLEDYGYLAGALPRLSIRLANFQIANEQAQTGIETFELNIDHVSGDISLYTDIARQLVRQQLSSKADEIVASAVTNNPGNIDAPIAAARWFTDAGKIDRAYDFTRQGLTLDPDHFSLRVHETRLRFERGEIDEALERFAELHKERPLDPEMRIHYSRCLASIKRDPRLASNLARGAVGYSFGSLESILNLCYVYLQQEHYGGVRGEGLRASRAYRDSPMAHYYVGLGEFKLGGENAAQALNRAVELGLGGEELIQAQEMLAQLGRG
jgi:tetratricopeptide (TPR) repeat protein